MNVQELKTRFPRASKSCVAANVDHDSKSLDSKNKGWDEASEWVDKCCQKILSKTPTPQKKIKRKGQAKRGMNQTEKQFYLRLVSDYPAANIIKYEPIKLRIGERCWYTPDFLVVDEDGLCYFFEVKGGHIWDDSKVKFRAAQEQYPWFGFQMWQKKKGGLWKQIA
jgi:hypothetical protein